MKNRALLVLAAFPLLLVALVLGSVAEPAAAQEIPSSATPKYRSFTGSISTSNAAITSDVASGKYLVIRSLTVASSQAGTLTFTDGSAGNALLHLYVAANTPRTLTSLDLGPQGIRMQTAGAEPYVNSLSSATISVGMFTTLE